MRIPSSSFKTNRIINYRFMGKALQLRSNAFNQGANFRLTFFQLPSRERERKRKQEKKKINEKKMGKPSETIVPIFLRWVRTMAKRSKIFRGTCGSSESLSEFFQGGVDALREGRASFIDIPFLSYEHANESTHSIRTFQRRLSRL